MKVKQFENPFLTKGIGLLFALALTKTFQQALYTAIFFVIVTGFVSLLYMGLSKWIVESQRKFVFLFLTASFVLILFLLVQAYLPVVYESLGSTILFAGLSSAVMCQTLSHQKNILSCCLVIIIIGLVREVLTTGTVGFFNPLTGAQMFQLPTLPIQTMALFESPMGAFLTVGIVIWVVQCISLKGVMYDRDN